MRCTVLTFEIIMTLMNLHSEAKNINKKCYTARICIHDNNEKCGIDSNGNYRRFYDTCDLLEYNCMYDTSYTKTSLEECDKLTTSTIKPTHMKRHCKTKPKF